MKEIGSSLAEEEERAKQLTRLKSKYESSISELEEKLHRETQMRADADRGRRRLEAELNDRIEVVNERNQTCEELENQLKRVDQELQGALAKVDEEIVSRTLGSKQVSCAEELDRKYNNQFIRSNK